MGKGKNEGTNHYQRDTILPRQHTIIAIQTAMLRNRVKIQTPSGNVNVSTAQPVKTTANALTGLFSQQDILPARLVHSITHITTVSAVKNRMADMPDDAPPSSQ